MEPAAEPIALRIATYNVEWFTHLFDRTGHLQADDGWSGRYNVTRAQQLEALTHVFTALDADAIMVIEAPDSNARRSAVTSLEAFAAHAGIRARKAVMGFANQTEQEIVLLFDPDRMSVEHAPQASDSAPRFDGRFRIDLDIDATPDVVTFSKPPLELLVQAGGQALRLVGVHVKSKAPHGARSEAEAMRLSIAARRKQLAQCIWLRRRIDDVLASDTPLIVLGDFNDGPGLDEYEKLFGRSGVEIVLGQGNTAQTQLYDPHARQILTGRFAAAPATARFYQRGAKMYFEALLDYAMVSPDLRGQGARWRIWHPFNDPAIYRDEGLRAALLTASDHFPVTLDLPVNG